MAQFVRWGIVGSGPVSRQFALSLRLLPDMQLRGVASRTEERAALFAAEVGAQLHYPDYEALVADPDLDVVYIATPPGLLHEHALLAIGAGKAVLCEKPFAASAPLARVVVNAARRAGVFCMEAMWMRFIPIMRELRQLISRGEIGDVRLLQADLGFPIPYSENSRYYDPKRGGGALLDLGVYPLSLAYYLLGSPKDCVALKTTAPGGVDEQMCMVLSYENALASLSCTFSNRARNSAFILGTRGQVDIHPPLYSPTSMTLTRSSSSAGATTALAARRRLDRLVDKIPRLVDLRRRFAPGLKAVFQRNRERITRHFSGFGYQFEAAEVARCLRARALESPVMPLDETVAILETADRLR